MYKFAYYLSCRKRRTHHSKKKQKRCFPTRDDDDDDAFNRASSTERPDNTSLNVSLNEGGSIPTAMGPHFSLRPHTGATGSDNGMNKNSCNEESSANKQNEERTHIEANKQYGGMSPVEFKKKRKVCGCCARRQSRIRSRRMGKINPVLMGCYSPGTEPNHIPYHLYTLVKRVAHFMARYKQSQNIDDLRDLPRVEEKIKFFCTYFHPHLPRGWEYERENASSLITGYDTFFTKDGPRYDLSGYTPFRDKLKSGYIANIMNIVHSRKTPAPETFKEWTWVKMLFYCKLCSCFGIDYQHLETASEDDVCLMNMGA